MTKEMLTWRNLVACLRESARRFGWADRAPRPAARRDGRRHRARCIRDLPITPPKLLW